MKKEYEKPEVELISLEMIDVLTVSPGDYREEDELPWIPQL